MLLEKVDKTTKEQEGKYEEKNQKINFLMNICKIEKIIVFIMN